MAIKRTCRVPDCGELIELDESACAKHKEIYKAKIKRKKLKTSERGYGRDWQIARAKHLREHPFCERPGCKNQTDEVHHVLPITDGGTHEQTNLLSLCFVHHHEIHDGKRKSKRYNGLDMSDSKEPTGFS